MINDSTVKKDRKVYKQGSTSPKADPFNSQSFPQNSFDYILQ